MLDSNILMRNSQLVMKAQVKHNIILEGSQYIELSSNYQWMENKFPMGKGIKLGIGFLKDNRNLERKAL